MHHTHSLRNGRPAAFLPSLPDKRCREAVTGLSKVPGVRPSHFLSLAHESLPFPQPGPKLPALLSLHTLMPKIFLGKEHLFEVRTGQWKLVGTPVWGPRICNPKNRVGCSSSGMVQRGAWLSYSWAQEEGGQFFTSSGKICFYKANYGLGWCRERKGRYSNKGVCCNINYPDDETPWLGQSSS